MALSVPGRAAPVDSPSAAPTDLPEHFESADPMSPDCLEPWPDIAATAAIPADTGKTVTLDVRVLLDGVTSARAGHIIGQVAKSLGPAKIVVKPSYVSVNFGGSTAEDMLRQASALYGGVRPAGIDVVHVLTSTNLLDAAGSTIPGGSADCIGGIKNPGYGFSVSEAYGLENFRIGPATLYYEAEAKLAAHEIAHLLGAQHHLSNCAEGVTSELEVLEPSPCTLMFPTVEAASLNLSTANRVIVRAYAVKYA